jgi:hypothetical protein
MRYEGSIEKYWQLQHLKINLKQIEFCLQEWMCDKTKGLRNIINHHNKITDFTTLSNGVKKDNELCSKTRPIFTF